MEHEEDGYIKEYHAHVKVGHFVAEATFCNPYSTTKGSWDYGFIFRYIDNKTFHAIRVTSDGRWKHNLVKNGKWETVGEGKASNLQTGATKYNHLQIIILGDNGAFYVNGRFVDTLDISGLIQKGDISVATGMIGGDEIEGEVTRFKDFTIWSLDTPVSGPSNGSLRHSEDGSIKTYRSGVDIKNFIVEATFYNPYSTTKGSWDYGFLCRHPRPNTHHAIRVNSDGSWVHSVVIDGDWKTAGKGTVSNLQTGAEQPNHLRVIVLGDNGEFYVNGRFIDSLDMSDLTGTGDIMTATGMASGNEIDGEVTRFREFSVWSLNIQSRFQAPGSIYVTSSPSGAGCYLGGDYKGRTPLTISDVPPGVYKITVRKDNYEEWWDSIRVSAGKTTKVSAILKIQMGSLSVDTNVNGAFVYLDDIFEGTTPLRADSISVGIHTIRISADKYRDYNDSIMIYANRTTYVDATLEEKPGTIYVESDPSGAEFYLNGSYKGKTPRSISANPGTYTITLKHDGYYDKTIYVDVYADEKTTEYICLQIEFWRTWYFAVGVVLTIITLFAAIFWHRRKQPTPLGESSIAKAVKGTVDASKKFFRAKFFSIDNLGDVTVPDEKNRCIINYDSLEKGEIIQCTRCKENGITHNMHKKCWKEYKVGAKRNEKGEIRCPINMDIYISEKNNIRSISRAVAS